MKILYRIVNALLALSVFPIVVFLDLVWFRVSPSVVDYGLEEKVSVKFIIDVITGKENFWHEMIFNNTSGSSITWPAALDPVKGRLITFAVCFVLILLIALFILIWSICTSKRLPVMIASVGGLISTIVMICCFNSAAGLIMDGTINIVSVFSTGWLASLLGGFISVDLLSLGGFHSALIFVFVGLIVWSGAYYLIELGEPKEEEKTSKHNK